MNNEQTLEVLKGISKAIDACGHYIAFTKRVLPHLQAALPEYTVAVYTHEKYGPKIKVWGKGNLYSESLDIWWSGLDVKHQAQTWVAGLQETLGRINPTDSMERQEQEAKVSPALNQLNAEALDILTRVRIKARAIIEALPEPKSSPPSRQGSHVWGRASSELSKQFPLLFDNEVDMQTVIKGKKDASTQSDEEG